jgi:hypothetical protein
LASKKSKKAGGDGPDLKFTRVLAVAHGRDPITERRNA